MRSLRLDIFALISIAALVSCANAPSDALDSVTSVGGSAQGGATRGDDVVGGSSTGGTSATKPASTASTSTNPDAGSGGTKASTVSSTTLGAGVGGTSVSSQALGGSVSSGGKAISTGGATVGGAGRSAVAGGSGKAVGGTSSGTGGRTGVGGKASGGGGAAAGTTATTPVITAGAPSFGEKFVGNITTGNSIDSGGLTYAKYWNQITPENAGKWGSVQSSAGSSFNWKTLDAIYAYTQTNNIIFKQHCFIWGAQQPGGTITEANVKTWMTEFCKRYPETKVIDVVNEPPPHTTPSYANSIGGGTNGDWKWIANAFTWARAACPNAILILNDYNNIEWSADNTRFINIVKAIKAANAPIDAVGAQSHDLDHGSVSLATVKNLLSKLHTDTGLPVYITEMDIDSTDDAKQLQLYQQYFPYFMQTDYVKGITIWGWIYGQTWSQAPNSGLVRSGKSRSAMTYIMGQLNRTAP